MTCEVITDDTSPGVDPIFAAIAEVERCHADVHDSADDSDEETSRLTTSLMRAESDLYATVATTLSGLLALVICIRKYAESEDPALAAIEESLRFIKYSNNRSLCA